ncbi:serine hydrolase FSH [Lasiosphaeria hispida]|uniref:Serine hydrolase FSH n=1 Tax=Lasiosphaeria hispida TaxID=260671 RepID=A0AAJ0HAD8_9PEZI|nr:serine hydrolase FSH [Lasiosphaeria hispida]
MKILCLHGAFNSASTFQMLLRPLMDAFEQLGSVEFVFLDGARISPVPDAKSFAFFGPPPHFRWFGSDDPTSIDFEYRSSVMRDVPRGRTPEDKVRHVFGDAALARQAYEPALARVLDFLRHQPDIDGVLGYSEGGSMASTVLFEEKRLFEQEGRPRQLKYGIFIGGTPGMAYAKNGTFKFLLADEVEHRLDVTTCHLVGCNDPFIHYSIASYNICDKEKAFIFDHGGGHNIPRDKRTVTELALSIKSVVETHVS